MYYVESADRLDRLEEYDTHDSSSTQSPSQSHSPDCVDGWIGGDRQDPLVPCRVHRAELWARLDRRRRRRRATARRPA